MIYKFRHCLEVVRLIQISLSSFNPLKRETEGGGGHLADINDKRHMFKVNLMNSL